MNERVAKIIAALMCKKTFPNRPKLVHMPRGTVVAAILVNHIAVRFVFRFGRINSPRGKQALRFFDINGSDMKHHILCCV